MLFLQLDLSARYRIYAQTKKVLRKYQKGINSGKLTSEQFVENMLKDDTMISILTDIQISIDEFRNSYKDYVETLINIQNNSLHPKKRSYIYYSQRASCSSIFKLKHILNDNGFKLSIPSEYLTQWDIDCIEKYVTTGVIDLGNEKIYNYVEKV